MNRRRKPDPRYTCEACGQDAGTAGVVCSACHRERCAALLACPEWCEVAATRSGDVAGESLLDQITREAGEVSA